MAGDTASALFGVEGLRVADAEREADGTLTVWVVTDHAGAAACPDCRTVSGRVHEYVLTRPRDVRRGLDEVSVAWCKRRWKCASQECCRVTFTESLPAVPPRCRLTSRLRDLLGAEVAERGCTVAEVGRWQHVSWPVAHAAFAERADPVLARASALVAHLGIDEHRRGRPRWRADADTGEYRLLADRWHTCFFDLSGDQGLLGQVEGRTADDAAYWLAQAPAAWRGRVEVVAIDMCSIYAAAVRRMLPAAQIVVDLFHEIPPGASPSTGRTRRPWPAGPAARAGKRRCHSPRPAPAAPATAGLGPGPTPRCRRTGSGTATDAGEHGGCGHRRTGLAGSVPPEQNARSARDRGRMRDRGWAHRTAAVGALLKPKPIRPRETGRTRFRDLWSRFRVAIGIGDA